VGAHEWTYQSKRFWRSKVPPSSWLAGSGECLSAGRGAIGKLLVAEPASLGPDAYLDHQRDKRKESLKIRELRVLRGPLIRHCTSRCTAAGLNQGNVQLSQRFLQDRRRRGHLPCPSSKRTDRLHEDQMPVRRGWAGASSQHWRMLFLGSPSIGKSCEPSFYPPEMCFRIFQEVTGAINLRD